MATNFVVLSDLLDGRLCSLLCLTNIITRKTLDKIHKLAYHSGILGGYNGLPLRLYSNGPLDKRQVLKKLNSQDCIWVENINKY